MSIISTNNTGSVNSTVKASSWVTITSLSGGVQLTSNSCKTMIVQNLATNSGNMHVGGLSGESPHATKGVILTPGNAVNLHIDNFDRVRVYAALSGERVAMIGET